MPDVTSGRVAAGKVKKLELLADAVLCTFVSDLLS